MTIRTAIHQGTEILMKSGVAEPRLTAELLIAHAVRCERIYLFAHPGQELREVEWLHYGRYLHERSQGKPAQYITQKQEFYGREFTVSPNVLIPRPETELLVETVLRLSPPSATILDVGTGSGAIAITLALETARRTFATDISEAALTVASANARKLAAPVQFLRTDLATSIGDETCDVVVSNPPYIPSRDRASLQREVRDWEPDLALFAGTSGTAVYEQLIPQAWRVLKPGGLLALELGIHLLEPVKELTRAWRTLEVGNDLAGIPRVLVCERTRQDKSCA